MKLRRVGFEQIGAILFGILAVGTILLQVYTAPQSNSPLTTTLFNVLQFIFSVIFAWIVTRMVTKKDFEDTQKQFAGAALRRIWELRESFSFLKKKVAEKARQSTSSMAELEMIESMTFGIEQTINSAIADWADIIGDEMAILQKVVKLKEQKEDALSDQPVRVTDYSTSAPLYALLKNNEGQIEQLLQRLPPKLRSIPDSKDNPAFFYKEDMERLDAEMKTNGYIEFSGFWDSSFECDIYNFKIGDHLFASIDDVADRKGALIVHAPDGKSVGVLTNKLKSKYSGFAIIAAEFLIKSRLKVEISSIESKSHGDRHYFKVRAR